MSNAVFPVLTGLTFPVLRTPLFNSMVQTGVDLSELRATFSNEPVYDITLSYDILRDTAVNEFRQLCGFFEARLGRFDSFLFTDPDDSNATTQVFGVGNNVTANFQLIRSFGDANASVSNLNSAPAITLNNVPTSNYTISSVGVVQFNAPPPENVVCRWTGTYYMRCRFSQDSAEFEKFMRLFWQAGQIQMRGCLGSKI